jgi:hypothetical protein
VAEFLTRCPGCSAEASPGTVFCGNCGTRLPEAAAESFIRCPSCSTEASPGTVFCGNCGRRLDETLSPATVVPPARPIKKLLLPAASVGGCENCGATDRADDGSCRACQGEPAEGPSAITTSPFATTTPAPRHQATAPATSNENRLPPATARTGNSAMTSDASTVRQQVPYSTRAVENTQTIGPPPGQYENVNAVRQPRIDDHRKASPAAFPAPPGRSSHSWRPWLLIAPLVLAALAGGVVIGHRNTTSTVKASQSTEQTSSTAPASTPAPTQAPTQAPIPAPDPGLVALAALNQQRTADLPTTPLDGQWVAQLSSKYDGISDPLQTSGSGSHTFSNVDILAEFQRLQGLDLGGASVTLLLSTDYGQKQTVSGHALWVTFALPGLSSASEVQSWCSTHFAPLTGPALADTCTPAQLYPPS